uniref:beta-ketoacyl-[acyl-carrier-protein] synthase III n=1 Tax=Grammatophora oceanica TaxID=210454 RepID=A0A7S1V1Q8_9STRA|mmetsp:Transcript_34164/g.50750  ORF Transcript_34164/g.50750 Transcript_34164/m.50750 type:complete len:337 (+) Transcript_34164:374-1384(+)
MASGGAMNCKCLGIGSAAPESRITNVDLESMVETSDEWITTRTGIQSRHVLKPEESLQVLASTAAKKALEMSGIDGKDVDMVIMATSSPQDSFGDASSVAAAIGSTGFAMDLTAACSGFLFAIVTASQFLETGSCKTAVVVGADALSRWTDWDDRNTCILFGDGAGAMVLQKCSEEGEPGLLGFATHSDGTGASSLTLPYAPKARTLATPGKHVISDAGYGKMYMEGREVYKFATREVPSVLEETLEAAGMTVDDIDWLLLHQANLRIMESVAKRLKIPMEKVIRNLNEYGNTSAASIPLALDEAVRSGQVKKGDVIACSGFGAGLSWGATILKWG